MFTYFVILFVLALPVVLLAILVNIYSQLRGLRARLDRLDYLASRAPAAPATEEAWSQAAAPDALTVTPPAAPAAPPAMRSVPPPAPPPPTASSPPRDRAASGAALEQLIGGVWLQNVGSVLLLVGVFLMILWGYTSGRVGPGVLVGSGVVLGLALVWRGDRIARHVEQFGHALIGVGIGIVYLTLYLGHVRLGVLPTWATFAALVAVSFGSVLAGIHYRERLIATLGILGAYLPFLMKAWLPIGGLAITPGVLLGYIALVNAFAFVMTVRAGWSSLGVVGLLFGTAAWIVSFAGVRWDWGIQLGLSAVFTLLGLAPLPRLVGAEERVSPADRAAIGLAPACLVAASWPFLAYADRTLVGMLLIGLAIVQLLAALWVDARRPERDLWRPLTAAAALFLAGALERWLGTERTPTAWCLEGLVLVALGLTPRGGGWLRLWGSLVVAAGVIWQMSTVAPFDWIPPELPFVYPGGLRGLGSLATVLAGGWLLSRNRRLLTAAEQWTPQVWTGVGHALLLVWSSREMEHLATALMQGRSHGPPLPAGFSVAGLRDDLSLALRGAAWMVQAGVVALTAPRQRGTFERWCAAAIGGLAFLVVLWRRAAGDTWAIDQTPVLHPLSLLGLGTIAIAVAASARLARSRDEAPPATRWMPHVWAVAACVMLLMWSSREAGHIAQAALGPEVKQRTVQVWTASAAITSGAWLLQAMALLGLGWMLRSPFLRWCGLALFGLTVIKFVVVDLTMVDVFWRFATAIALGAAMLAISYHYRRRSQAPRA